MTKEEITGVTIEGWCVITDTLCGGPSLWTVQELPETDIMPEVWSTQDEARKDLISNYIEHLQSFIDGEREWDETDISGPEEYVGVCRIEDGQLIVHNEDGDLILDKPINEWRGSL